MEQTSSNPPAADIPGTAGARRIRPRLSAVAAPGWIARESLELFAPGQGMHMVASTEPLDPAVDLRRYVASYSERLAATLPEYAEHSLESLITAAGRTLPLRRFEWRSQAGERVTQLQAYWVEDATGFMATATADAAAFDAVEPELRGLLSTLDFAVRRGSAQVGRRDLRDGGRERAYAAYVAGEPPAAPSAPSAGVQPDWSAVAEAWRASAEGA